MVLPAVVAGAALVSVTSGCPVAIAHGDSKMLLSSSRTPLVWALAEIGVVTEKLWPAR